MADIISGCLRILAWGSVRISVHIADAQGHKSLSFIVFMTSPYHCSVQLSFTKNANSKLSMIIKKQMIAENIITSE